MSVGFALLRQAVGFAVDSGAPPLDSRPPSVVVSGWHRTGQALPFPWPILRFRERKKNRDRNQAGLARRVERLETWFVMALIALITVLGGALVAVLLR